MSVSIVKGLSRGEGLSFVRAEFSDGLIEFEEDVGDFILLEDDTSILLEDLGSTLVLE